MDWFNTAHLEADTLFISDEVFSQEEQLSRAQYFVKANFLSEIPMSC